MDQHGGTIPDARGQADEGCAPAILHPLSAARFVDRTLRLKVRREGYTWLNIAGMEVSTVWNWGAEISEKTATTCARRRRWLSGFDLDNLSSGATECFKHIGAATIQRVNGEYALKRQTAKKIRLRWRTSKGPRRSLGWVAFKSASLRCHGKVVRFCGKTFRVFELSALWA